jgi:hypothetical protein
MTLDQGDTPRIEIVRIGTPKIEYELRQFLVALVGIRVHGAFQRPVDPHGDFTVVVNGRVVSEAALL